jgi:hypothetical protein
MPSKVCPRCLLPKDLEKDFSRHAGKKDGRSSACKPCEVVRVKTYSDAHPAKVVARVRRWEAANPGKSAEYAVAARERARAAVFAHYGKSCACCGAVENLNIDHVDGRGAEHRRELFGTARRAGYPFYFWLIRQGFPGGFQTLCWPCNKSKETGERCVLDHEVPHGAS